MTRHQSSGFDRNEILARFDGDMEIFKAITELFLDDTPNRMSEIRESIHNRDGEALKQAAHALKGSVSNFDSQSSYDLAGKLESVGQKNDFTSASQLYAELERAVTRLMDELAAMLQE